MVYLRTTSQLWMLRDSPFSSTKEDFDHIPPSTNALHQHLHRVAHQWTCMGQYTCQRPCNSIAVSMGMAARFPRLSTNSCLHYNCHYFKVFAKTCHLKV
ncbi:hypothetical protein UPYG_G00220740 [Umbra pygmaea]|uniref:Uncharacterized protein n=1 Tax=Umbra pygmaea TaxID=75934 RepID=A0ABD0WGN0_UMBPY